jgi:hypothetical protein
VDHVAHLVLHHMVIYSPEWSDAAVRRFLKRVGRDHVEEIIDLAIADVRAQGKSDHLVPLAEQLRGRARAQMEAGAALTRSDLAVSGRDLMEALGLEPGPRLGRILEGLLARVIDEPSLNTPEALIDLASELNRDPGEEG